MRVGEEWQDVSAGDAVYIPINAVHSLRIPETKISGWWLWSDLHFPLTTFFIIRIDRKWVNRPVTSKGQIDQV